LVVLFGIRSTHNNLEMYLSEFELLTSKLNHE
jgi:hypothetical protein